MIRLCAISHLDGEKHLSKIIDRLLGRDAQQRQQDESQPSIHASNVWFVDNGVKWTLEEYIEILDGNIFLIHEALKAHNLSLLLVKMCHS
jgi:hypothetical protein